MSDPTGFRDDSEFRNAITDLLNGIVDQLDAVDLPSADDLDLRLIPGSLQVTFEDTGAVFVLSQQTPTHELWLSANLRAWHFKRPAGLWIERDSEEPLSAVLSTLFSEKLGGAVRIRA